MNFLIDTHSINQQRFFIVMHVSLATGCSAIWCNVEGITMSSRGTGGEFEAVPHVYESAVYTGLELRRVGYISVRGFPRIDLYKQRRQTGPS